MDLAQLIAQAIEKKQGNKEFALFFGWGDEEWCAMIGNPSDWVPLGETSGEFVGEGATPEAAVIALLAELPP